ncbi:MAG: SIS domain-containing protein [Nanoarchaeota archaeon]
MIKIYFQEIKDVCDAIDQEEIQRMIEALRSFQGRLFILGNGGSAANASHAVNDFRKIAGIETYAPSDNVAELSAWTNDEDWKYSFSEWLKESKINEDDAVFVLSVNGGNDIVSPNIQLALEIAKSRKAKIFGIVGKKGGYTKDIADCCIIIPSTNSGIVESFQSIIWHLLVSHLAHGISSTPDTSYILKNADSTATTLS